MMRRTAPARFEKLDAKPGAFGIDGHATDIKTHQKAKSKRSRLNAAIEYALALHGITARAQPSKVAGIIYKDVAEKYRQDISEKQVYRHLRDIFKFETS